MLHATSLNNSNGFYFLFRSCEYKFLKSAIVCTHIEAENQSCHSSILFKNCATQSDTQNKEERTIQ